MWDCVETDFGGEETANFGGRNEGGTALYQVDTLATISSNEKPTTEQPHIVSSVLGTYSCIAVETHLSVFKDSHFAVTLNFGAVIEVTEWAGDGQYLFVGACSGTLFILETDSLEVIFTLTTVPEEDRVDGKAFKQLLCHPTREGVFDLMTLSAVGMLYIIKDVNQEELKNGGGNQESWQQKLTSVQTGQFHTDTHTVLAHRDIVVTLGSGRSTVVVWKWVEEELIAFDEFGGLLPHDGGYVAGKISSDGNYLFCLDTNCHIHILYVDALVICEEWKEDKVLEFQLQETVEVHNNSLQGMKLVMACETAKGQNSVKILNLPRLECVYTLQLSAPTSLARCLLTQEDLYIAEGCCDESDPSVVTTVRFRSLTETNPETRLARILRKNRFDEAENFAKLFNLDVELVHKVWLNHVLDQLSPWGQASNNPDQQEILREQLWRSVQNITDDIHVANICAPTALPTFVDTEKLLVYCQERLKKSSTSASDKRYVITKVLELLHRLETLKRAYGVENYKAEWWEQFQKTSLLPLCRAALAQGKLEIAFTLWSRHQAEFEEAATPQMLGSLLTSIPDAVPAASLQSWLCEDLVPFVSRVLPEAMSIFVRWLLQRTSNMELTEPDSWPSSGLQFLTEVHKSLNANARVSISSSVHTPTHMAAMVSGVSAFREIPSRLLEGITKINYFETFVPVQTLIHNLQQLQELKSRFNCHLSLAQFLQETTESVAFRMLDKVVAVELIMPTLEKQIRPYMWEHGLDEDHIFAKYIKDLLERMGCIVSSTGESPWEDKALAILSYIRQPKEKCQALLELMQQAPLPWSPHLESAIQDGLAIQHFMAGQLKEQYHMVQVKRLMLKYNLKTVTVPSAVYAEKLIPYILNKDGPSSVEDALEVLRLYDLHSQGKLYLWRASFLIRNNRVDEYLELLKTLPEDLRLELGQRIISDARVLLNADRGVEDEMFALQKQLYTEAAIYTAKELQPLEKDAEESEKTYKTLKRILALQQEYDIYINEVQIDERSVCEKLFLTFMRKLLSQHSTSETTINYCQVYRLATLLAIPHARVQGQMAIRAAQSGDIATAVSLCHKLLEYEPSAQTAGTLEQVALELLCLETQDAADTPQLRNLPQLTLTLAHHASTYCSTDALLHSLELCKAARLAVVISRQCEAGEYSLSVQGPCEGGAGRSMGTLGDHFQEEALVMDSNLVLPLVAGFVSVNPLLSPSEACRSEERETRRASSMRVKSSSTPERSGKAPGESFLKRTMPVLEFLQQNNHLQLALETLLYMQGVVVQFSSQAAMGFPHQLPNQLEQQEQRQLLKKNMEEKIQPLLLRLKTDLLKKMVNSHRMDQCLVLTFCVSLPQKQGVSCFKKLVVNLGYNYKKLMALSSIGVCLGELYQETKLVELFNILDVNAFWGQRLGKIKICFKEAFQGGMKEKLSVLTQLAQSRCRDLEVIQDYCRAFDLEEDQGLLLCLDNLLLQSDQREESATSRSQRLASARTAVAAISQRAVLQDKLESIIKQVSPYDYETLAFLLEELNNLQPSPSLEKGLKLLDHLKVYTRVAPPSDYEVKNRTEGKGEEMGNLLGCLPPASNKRLPYHSLMGSNAWKIISPELDGNTINQWVPIASLLQLSADVVYVTAVQNIVSQHVAARKLVGMASNRSAVDKRCLNWDFDPASLALLETVRSLLGRVSNCSTAMAGARWVVKELPMGGEKVLGLKGCMTFAEKWYQVCPDDSSEKAMAQTAFEKFAEIHHQLSTEGVLYSHGLTEPQYLELSCKPKELIPRLYQHPTLVQDSVTSKRPDTHAVCKAIAGIWDLNFDRLRLELVEQWLPSGSNKQEEEETMTFNFQNLKMVEEDDKMDEDDSLKRVCYLLQEGSAEENVIYLLNYIFKDQGKAEMLGNLCRVRALHCLLQLADDAMLLKHSTQTRQDFSRMLHVLCYLVGLEQLHVQYSVETFEEKDKEAMAKGLWRHHRNQKAGVQVVAMLCLDYKIYDPDLLNSLLVQMMGLNMIKLLEQVVLRLSGVSRVWSLPAFSKAWQRLLSSRLSVLSKPLTKEQEVECKRIFKLLERCPVPHSLDLQALAQQFSSLEMSELAVACLKLSPV